MGKYALFGLKSLWKSLLKPKAIIGKESVELGKDLLKENKGNIQKIISKRVRMFYRDCWIEEE